MEKVILEQILVVSQYFLIPKVGAEHREKAKKGKDYFDVFGAMHKVAGGALGGVNKVVGGALGGVGSVAGGAIDGANIVADGAVGGALCLLTNNCRRRRPVTRPPRYTSPYHLSQVFHGSRRPATRPPTHLFQYTNNPWHDPYW